MKRKTWRTIALGAVTVGAVVYFIAFGQVSPIIIIPPPVTHSVDDVYALLAKLEEKLNALTAQVTQMQSVVGSVSEEIATSGGYSLRVSTGLAQFLWGYTLPNGGVSAPFDYHAFRVNMGMGRTDATVQQALGEVIRKLEKLVP